MSQAVLIAAVVCPKCKKERVLNAEALGKWISRGGFDCIECGPQARPDKLWVCDAEIETGLQVKGRVELTEAPPVIAPVVPAAAPPVPVPAEPPAPAVSDKPKKASKKEKANE